MEVTWGGFSLTTERLRLYLPTSEVFVDAPFVARFEGTEVTGEGLYFSFAREEGWVEKAKLSYLLRGRGELLFRGKRFSYSQGTWKGSDILCTGCRREPPLLSLRAKEVTISPEGKVTLEGLSLYVRNRKILEIPWYTRVLGQGGGDFLPALGFSRSRGWYTGFRYEYTFAPDVLFLARYILTTRAGQELKTDLVFASEGFKGQVFWDTRFLGDDTFGVAASYTKGAASFLVLATQRERVDSHTLSRSPQFVASLKEHLSSHVTLEGQLGYGYFTTEDLAGSRYDARLTLAFERDNFKALAFGWATVFQDESFTRAGVEVSWEKDLSPNFWARFSLRLVEGDTSPFFFDPQPESLASFEFLWGEEEASFFRVRGRYDLKAQNFRDWTVGVGLGSEALSLGVEGVYSWSAGSFTEQRYFLRKRIEDCVDVEVALFEPEGSFFVAVNFLGLDKPHRAESLFDEKESFDPLGFERDLSTP